MLNLYSITQDFSQLLELRAQAIEEENQEQLELTEIALSLTEDNFSEKANNYVKFIRSQELEAKMIDEEIKRLTDLKKSKENKAVSLKDRLEKSMLEIGFKEFDLGLFKLSFRKSESLNVESIDNLPNEFLRTKTTVEADKVALKNAIKSGGTFDGVSIKTSFSLQIK